MLVFLTNNSSWKKVSKRKKFKKDFGEEENAFDDDFRIGIQIRHYKKTRESKLNLYAPLYDSDIIVASPINLRVTTGQEGDTSTQKFDFDFLASI